MEEWKKLALTGIILIVLAIAFGLLKKGSTIWVVLVILLGVADIAIALYRKKIS